MFYLLSTWKSKINEIKNMVKCGKRIKIRVMEKPSHSTTFARAMLSIVCILMQFLTT